MLKGVAARVGWIVEDNGTVTGVIRVGETKQAAPALPRGAGTITVDGSTITVTPVGGDEPVVPR